jgi:hypothetical protein
VLSAKDETVLKTQMAGMNRQVVGWFHSHTRSEILFSPQDMQLHETFFPQPWHIGMVLRPANMKPLRANYYFRDHSGALVPGKSEFIVDVLRGGEPEKPVIKALPVLTLPVVAPPVVAPPVVLAPVAAPLPAVPAAAFERPPIPQSKPVERRVVPDPPAVASRPPAVPVPPARSKPNFYVLAALLTLFGLAVTAYLTQSRWLTKPPEPLKLQASDVDGRLLIRWIPVRDAQAGKLHITDGTKQTDVDLDAMQLGQGFYLYNREAVNETVRLKVGEREDTTSFAGPLTIPNAGVPGLPKR